MLQAAVSAVGQAPGPDGWIDVPPRVAPGPSMVASYRGGRAGSRPMRIGVWNYYEEITRNGFLFKNTEAAIGADLLKPWVDLHAYGQAHGIEFVTLDQVGGPEQLDAVIFMDRPREGHPLIDALMRADIRKYLILYECEVIKPDNWDTGYHQLFDRVFTWSDAHVDGRRYIKTNFAIDPVSPFDFAMLKSAFAQRKLATIIAGAKAHHHPYELYSERVRAIRWYEASAPDDFDLYGMGWNRDDFPSYRGPVQDKLGTLARYRFMLCYENAKNIPGYITEKILDCFRAGVVPVYAGAPNITQWIPADCFIDLRNFGTFAEMHEFIAAMDSATHGAYLDRIAHYLNSRQCYPFSAECFIKTVTEVMAYDVQLARGETPQLLLSAQARGENANGTLYQNRETMEIELAPADVPAASTSPAPAPGSAEARAASFQRGHRDLVVFFGYGDEMPVFVRARALWEFFISHYPNVRAIFVRETEKLGRGEVQHNGHDLLIGIGGDQAPGTLESRGYAATGTWSANENGRAIYRQMAVYDYLLRTHDRPFYVYQSTITSVVDLRGLLAALDHMPQTGCYAGMPGRLASPPEYEGLNFVCGTNSLFSSDMMALMRSRYDPNHVYATLPNDIWQALVLQDIARIPMAFFSFVKPRRQGDSHDDVRAMTRCLLADGHFHFRIKTTSEQEGLGRREDVDPWIMLRVMEEILASDGHPAANLRLMKQLADAAGTPDGKMQAKGEDSFFNGQRGFPLNDIEAPIVYPQLAG